MRGSASVQINRPAEDVWAMVSDVTRMGSWSPETHTNQWLDGATGPAVGACFKGSNRKGIVRWTTKVRITECEPGRTFSFTTMSRNRDATRWTYEFVSTDDGGCEVTESYEVVWEPWYGKVVQPERRRGPQLDSGMRMTLDRLKAHAEAGI
jgi:uncharacterized protein YndB with AHSA1/START domain